MIDHLTFKVTDIEKTKSFYTKVLAPLGYQMSFDQKFGEVRVIGFGIGKKIDTWFTNDRPVGGPVHIAWLARSQREVDEFYKAAMELGAKDNGKPGPRPEYHANYYGAFVLDPDGHNIEAVYHG